MTRQTVLLVAAFIALIGLAGEASPAHAGNGRLEVEYTVKIDSLGEQLFQVTTAVRNIESPELELSLPLVRLGVYATNFFVKNISDFKVTDRDGKPLRTTMSAKQTWRVATKGVKDLMVSFRYRGDVVSAGQAYVENEFAFFDGVNLFLQVNGSIKTAARVRFELPPGWKVQSTLRETPDAKVWAADNYDVLADSQTMLGVFDSTKFDVDGKPCYFVAVPRGWYSKERTDELIEMVSKVNRTQSAIFGDRPFEKYVYFYIFKDRYVGPGSTTSPMVQSANSHLQVVPPDVKVATPAILFAAVNHNFFHLWNLMRMRPAEYWPHNYSREVETPLLWLAEGFTRYYMTITRLRSHYGTRDDFLYRLSEAIQDTETCSGRPYISLADTSVLAAVRDIGPPQMNLSYVMAGHVIGVLLDLSIRQDTNGRASLDDVMRTLYQETYKRGRGYTTEDVIGIINRITQRNYQEFFDRYISGIEVPPYDKILGYAGYRLDVQVQTRPSLGIAIDPDTARVIRVVRNSASDAAGVMNGDLLVDVEGANIKEKGFGAVRDALNAKRGGLIRISVSRDGAVKSLEGKVTDVEDRTCKVVEVSNPTPEQLNLRNAWLKQ